MKKMVSIIVTAMILLSSTVCFAESGGEIIMKDTLYGAVTGAVIGLAVLAFQDDPGDHLNYISFGAGAGAIAGALFGVYEATALATYDNGEIKIAMPTIQTNMHGNYKKDIRTSANIVKLNF